MTSSSKTPINMEKLANDLKQVISFLTEIKQMINAQQSDININKENINFMLVKVSDLSSKVDWDISSNVKNKANSKIDSANGGAIDSPRGKKGPNIQQYCKEKYMESPSFFIKKKLITQADMDAAFEKCSDEIEKAKGKLKKDKQAVEKAKAAIVYKQLFSGTDTNMKNLKAIKTAEENDKIQLISEMKETDSTLTSSSTRKSKKPAKIIKHDSDASGEEEEESD
jgi:hypothetical protein